jgi:DNA-directed RNA polymerase I and III subunit RPAC2
MPESVHSQDLDQSMVDAEQEQPAELPQSNDPILEERQIVVVRI